MSSPTKGEATFTSSRVSAAVLPAALVLAAGSLEAEGNLRDVLSGFEYSLRASELDALIYVLPPYLALMSLTALLLLSNEARSGRLAGLAGAFVLVAMCAHTLGLARLVDRTPRDFPWEIMTAIGVLCAVAVVVLVAAARNAEHRRRWGTVMMAHAVLLVPLSVSLIPQGRERFVLPYAAHWFGQIGLGAVSLAWMRKDSPQGATARLPLARGMRWLTAATLLVLLFALPIWPSLAIVRSRYETHESCGSEIQLGSLWQAGPGHDSVCPDTASYAVSGVVLLVAALAALGVVFWTRRASALRS
jgi:hypothetical protein